MAKKKTEQRYEEALDKLQDIVGRLERKEIQIDELPKTVREAKDLVAFCREKLDRTEAEISRIIRPEDAAFNDQE